MRAAIYARYSSDRQNPASVEDQVRDCTRLVDNNGWTLIDTYTDYAISGSISQRLGLQSLIRDAEAGHFDVVVAESLDRLNRGLAKSATFYDLMEFAGVEIFTTSEQKVGELEIGFKGLMGGIFLKDLAQKTRRGQEGRIRKGKSAGGVTYGYDVVRNILADGMVTTGERSINNDQASIIRRIFREYSHGISPRAIAARLNEEGVPGPRNTWGASTIYGNHQRGTGILNNELYIGRLVWNRQRFVKDPTTGKRQARLNPEEEWVREDVPHLQIVDLELWSAVKKRQQSTRNRAISDGINKVGRTKRAKHLFSGMLKCGCCGGGYIQVGKHYYGCSAKRNKGTCDNSLTMKREELEKRVLVGLKEQLLHPDLIAEFVAAYQVEFNRLRANSSKGKAKAKQELAKVIKQIDKIIEAITEGMFHNSMKSKMDELETRKAALETEVANAEAEPPVLLHPGLADIYKEKVANLSEALDDPETKAEATSIIRGMLCEIRLIPEEDKLSIELVGELAGLMSLGAAQNEQSRPEAACSTVMVAGAGFEPATFRL